MPLNGIASRRNTPPASTVKAERTSSAAETRSVTPDWTTMPEESVTGAARATVPEPAKSRAPSFEPSARAQESVSEALFVKATASVSLTASASAPTIVDAPPTVRDRPPPSSEPSEPLFVAFVKMESCNVSGLESSDVQKRGLWRNVRTAFVAARTGESTASKASDVLTAFMTKLVGKRLRFRARKTLFVETAAPSPTKESAATSTSFPSP